MAKNKATNVAPKLTEGEQGLLSRMEGGYQLETDSLGSNPVLRRLKDGEVIRPLSANAITVKALDDVADDARYGIYTFITTSEKPRDLEIADVCRHLAELGDLTSASSDTSR
jgi:hypothetical protein